MEKPNFSEFSENYEESLGFRHKYFIKTKCEELLGVLKQHFGSVDGLRCLDLGCGTGEAEEYLGSFDIVGIDYTLGMLMHAREKNTKYDFLLSSACSLPIRDSSFDVVFSMCMMHHIPDSRDRVKVFNEAGRVLKDGGLLIVFEHNPYNPYTRYVVRTCPMDRNARLISAYDLKKYYQNSGMQSITIRYILFIPFAIRKAQPIDNVLGLLPMGGQYYMAGRKTLRL